MKILMFSGGLDSTYLAWKLLAAGEKIHLHHVSIRVSTGTRWLNEDTAVVDIIKYFKEQDFKFEHSTSIFEFYGIADIGFDSDTLLLHAQKLAQNIRNERVEVLLGWNPYDLTRPEIAERSERGVTGNIWKALVESTYNRKIIDRELKFPLIEWGINKDTMIKELPHELLCLTWTCRMGGEEPCGYCHSCVEKESALAQH